MKYTPEILSALGKFIVALESWGIPGLIALLLVVPAFTVVAIFTLDFLRQRHTRRHDEERRQEARADRELVRAIVEEHRTQTIDMMEQHNRSMEHVLRDLGEKHGEVSQYYRDNVELVKSTQRIALDMRDIIVNNTRVVEHLVGVAQNNLFCPMARERSTGRP